ncbi:MAG: T9SS type A sorting domain-containing protein [Ignavibacteria bacterium]|nr:T9SS type A sorting domain-containing protein [Ignavibacteria bacterium]
MKKVIYLFILINIISLQADAQWIAQNSGTNQNLYDIEFLNDKTGWAVGDAGVVIKTTDGGTTWINIPNPSPMYSPNLWSVLPIDSSIVFVTSGKDLIMKTLNGGLNWQILNYCPSCNSGMKRAFFLNQDTGWFLGANKVFRTYDGGNSLDSFYAPWFTNYDIYFKDINNGLFCGDGRVFKSNNGGESWFDTNVPVGGTFYMFQDLGVSNNNVWVVGSSSPVFRSTDFCESWEIITSGQQIGGYTIHFVNDNTGYVGRSLNNLIKTTNGGYNWYQQQTDPNSLAFISSIAFSNDTIGWYACAVGRIYNTTTGGQWITNISSIELEIPNSFRLDQNFPNPFNSQTKINFTITNAGNYILEIYDTRGNRIQEIFNESLDPGRYNLIYNAGTLSSGIYFYKLTGADITETRRMILLK